MNKKIAIVDDHEFYRNGLVLALKHFKFVDIAFEATNGKEFLEKQEINPVDIVFLDLKMPVLDGYETILRAKEQFPKLKIIVLTMFEEDEYIRKSITAGVQGYLIKNIDQKTLKTALQYVLDGRSYFSNELMPFFTRELNEITQSTKNNIKLSKRELEILKLICEGFSNSEIAEKLFISIRTVNNHRANLKTKTKSKNTAALISYGIKNRIVNL